MTHVSWTSWSSLIWSKTVRLLLIWGSFTYNNSEFDFLPSQFCFLKFLHCPVKSFSVLETDFPFSFATSDMCVRVGYFPNSSHKVLQIGPTEFNLTLTRVKKEGQIKIKWRTGVNTQHWIIRRIPTRVENRAGTPAQHHSIRYWRTTGPIRNTQNDQISRSTHFYQSNIPSGVHFRFHFRCHFRCHFRITWPTAHSNQTRIKNGSNSFVFCQLKTEQKRKKD